MSEKLQVGVGDLVIFNEFYNNQIERILWRGPDYGPDSLDIEFVVNTNDFLLVLRFGDGDNVLVLSRRGTIGWTKLFLLKCISCFTENVK